MEDLEIEKASESRICNVGPSNLLRSSFKGSERFRSHTPRQGNRFKIAKWTEGACSSAHLMNPFPINSNRELAESASVKTLPGRSEPNWEDTS